MQIIKVASTCNEPTYKARFVTRGKGISTFINTMNKNADTAILLEGVINAFEKHPSMIKVKTSINNSAGFWGARGVIETKFAKLVDVEPANQNKTHPIKNILRRILDPENKEKFNQLMGGKHNDKYDAWWSENVAPIWDRINSTFREKTFFEGNYDKEFNSDFQAQVEKTWQKVLVKENNL